jgi:hypothetical protein
MDANKHGSTFVRVVQIRLANGPASAGMQPNNVAEMQYC